VKKIISLAFTIVTVILLGASPVLAGSDNYSAYFYQPEAEKGHNYAQDQILVSFRQNVEPSEMSLIHRQYGGSVKGTISALGVQVVNIPQGKVVEKVKAYSANPKVAYAEPDYQCQAIGSPDDIYFGMQWGLGKIEATQAWDVTQGNGNINIAILDTGVDIDHPDLAGKVIANVNFSSSSTTDDIHGHGTHVAGIVAANTNNGIGVTGVGYDSTIMNVKVLGDNGSGFYSSLATGIVWAADNGAEIISLSLGGTTSSITLENIINNATRNQRKTFIPSRRPARNSTNFNLNLF